MKSDLKVIVEREVRQVEQARNARVAFESTYDVLARVSPELQKPEHLWPYIAVWDYAVKRPRGAPGIKVCFHAPPQHGKSLTGYHGLLFAVLWDIQNGLTPRHHAYSTYNADKAKESQKVFVQLAKQAGLNPKPSGPHVHLEGGSVIHFMGAVAGTLTGHKVDGIHLIDDPIKDRKEANSAQLREDRWSWFVDIAGTRQHPGSSTIVMHTRWHYDDLAGRIIRQRKWPYLRLAAECDSEDDPLHRVLGEPLWPAGGRTNAWLQEFKLSPLTWASMYQGHPRPVGDTLFQEPIYYDALPTKGYRRGYGADLAYTTNTRSDWSVLLGAREYGSEIFLTSLLRKQMQADRFTKQMKARIEHEPGPAMWFGNTVERGVHALIREKIPSFRFALASVDKYTRALPTAEKLWNPRRILVPQLPDTDPQASIWADFVHEVIMFTGQDDPQDDQVDALAALGHLFLRGSTSSDYAAVSAALKAGMRKHQRHVS